jgi:hypothetical protein
VCLKDEDVTSCCVAVINFSFEPCGNQKGQSIFNGYTLTEAVYPERVAPPLYKFECYPSNVAIMKFSEKEIKIALQQKMGIIEVNNTDL